MSLQEARIPALRATLEGESGPPLPPFPGLKPPPLPRPHWEEEAQPAFAGEAGQAGA